MADDSESFDEPYTRLEPAFSHHTTSHSYAEPLGISLQGLLELVRAHGGRGALAGLSTGAVKRLVLAATGHTRNSNAAQQLASGTPHYNHLPRL